MARLVTSGGEIRDHPTSDIGSPDGYSGNATQPTTTETDKVNGLVRSGQASFKCAATSANGSLRVFPFSAPAAGTSLFGRVYLRLPSLPTSATPVARFSAGATNIVSARLTAAGKVQLWNDVAGTQIGSDSADTLAVNRWYRIELKVTIAAGATDEAELRLATDEALPPDYASTQVASATGVSITDTQPTEFRAGWVASPGLTANCYIDDVAVNDSTGTSQTAHPGEERVFVLLPISDDTSSASWLNESGNTTNRYLSVDNRPPTGPSNELKNTSGTMPQEYRAVIQTYGVAGVPGHVIQESAGGAGKPFGATGSDAAHAEQHAQRLQLTGSLDNIDLNLKYVGSAPSDNVIVEVQTADGTVLATGTVAGSSVGSSASWVSVRNFDAAVVFEPTDFFWLVLRRSGTLSDTNYYVWSTATSNLAYPLLGAGGDMQAYYSAAWTGQTGATAFRVFVSDGLSNIAVIRPVVCHAETVSTGSKTGAVSLTGDASINAEPAVASSAFTYGDNAGAVSAYPGTWRWHKGTTSYDGVRSMGAHPKLLVEKTDTGTREALVCFLGVTVACQPPASPGWQEYIKTSDSTHWWAKYVSSTTVIEWGTMGANQTEILAGDYALHADPLPAEGADMGTVTSVTKATLASDYTKV